MEVRASISINASAKSVWKTLRDFNGLAKWSPGIIESRMEGTGVGAIRHLRAVDGSRISERLEAFDDEGMALSYSFVEEALPVKDYLSTMIVTHGDASSSCSVSWRCTGEPRGVPEEKIESILNRLYTAGLEKLKAHCELQETTLTMKKISSPEAR